MALLPISFGCYAVSGYHPRGRGSPQGIDGAPDAPSAPVQDMSIDHGGLDVFVTEQLLYGPDIVPVFQEMRRPAQCGINSGVAQGVAGSVRGL
jgi:hypothetical protein